MLPKAYQANPAEIDHVREEGVFTHSPLFALLVTFLSHCQPSKFAFIVSTKISKKAVERNRLKRQLRESVKKQLPFLKKGYLVLFLAKKNLLGKNFSIIQKEVIMMLEKNKLLKNTV